MTRVCLFILRGWFNQNDEKENIVDTFGHVRYILHNQFFQYQ